MKNVVWWMVGATRYEMQFKRLGIAILRVQYWRWSKRMGFIKFYWYGDDQLS